MLILLTYQCMEKCTHCMHNCTPSDTDMMTDDVFEQLERFIILYGFQGMLVQISGGEPTLHPKFDRYIGRLTKLPITLMLESNGSFYQHQHVYEKVQSLLEVYPNVHLQIRTDIQFYPNYTNIVTNPLLTVLPRTQVLTGAITLFPLGRALQYHRVQCNMAQNPACSMWRTNFRLHRFTDVKDAILKMQVIANKFCKPMIDPFGNIYIGESRFCESIGSLSSPQDVLIEAAAHFECDKCGLVGNLEKALRGML